MRTHRVSLVGESFLNDDGSSRQDEIERCGEGESVELVRQPDNPYDPNCVRVVSARGVQIANLGRADAARIAKRLDAGERLAASIDFIGESDSGWLGVVLTVSKASRAGEPPAPPRPAPAPAPKDGAMRWLRRLFG